MEVYEKPAKTKSEGIFSSRKSLFGPIMIYHFVYSKVSNKRWGDVYFFQDFFGQNHATFSSKTSILQETVEQFDY